MGCGANAPQKKGAVTVGVFNFARLIEQDRTRRSYGGRKRKKKRRSDKPARVEGWRGSVSVPLMEGLGHVIRTFEAEGRAVHVGPRNLTTGQTALWVGSVPKGKRPICGAKTRRGTPCQARAVPGMGGNNRCRMHGGLSTGPKTAEGRARIAESNRRRVRERGQS